MVGLADRGEMVTQDPSTYATSPTATTPIASDTSFFQVPQNPNGVDPKQSLVGAYELIIRRGQQYATSLVGYSDSIAINPALLIQGDDRLEQQYTLVAPAATALAFSVGSLPSDGDTFTVNDGLGTRGRSSSILA